MDYFEADIAISQMFTSDVIKARNVSNVIYHKFSHGAAFYTPNGKSVNVMLECQLMKCYIVRHVVCKITAIFCQIAFQII